MKKILIIGAGWEQEPLVKEAHELGCYVIATNSIFNPEGFYYADEYYQIDSRDLEKIELLFLDKKPDAVISDECDYSMFAVAYLCSKYNLPGPDLDSLIITNNKYLQRKIADEASINQPKFKLCYTYQDFKEACELFGYPVIAKPIDNRGSIGINIISNKSELADSFYNSVKNSHSRQIIVEEFISGLVVSVDGYYSDKFYNLISASKRMSPDCIINAMELTFPALLSEEIIREIYVINEKICAAFKFTTGPVHSEFIINEKGIFFVESANRGGGVHISNIIVNKICNLNMPAIMIKTALGYEPPSLNVKPLGVSILHFFEPLKGKVVAIVKDIKLQKMNAILKMRINIKIGDEIKSMTNATFRPGFVIVTGDSVEECRSSIGIINSSLKIVTSD